MDILQGPTNGKNYLVKEARRSQGIPCTREHRDKGVIGDEAFCIIALAAKDKVWVSDAYIASGVDAYLFVDREDLHMIGETDDDLPPDFAGHAFHYIIGTKASILRDLFDQNKSLEHHLVWLWAPSPSQTKLYREATWQKRKEKEKKEKAEKAKATPVMTVTSVKNDSVPHRKTAKPKNKPAAEDDKSSSLALPVKVPTKRRLNRMQRLNVPRRQPAPIIHIEE